MELPTITIPRLEKESTPAYTARVEYITAGPDRDIRSVAQRLHKSSTIIGQWSRRHGWVELASQYDQTVASMIAARAAERYITDLEDHRVRYMAAGQKLYDLCLVLITRLEHASFPESAAGIARALTVAADLEAHALQLDLLMPRIQDEMVSSE